MLRSSASPVSLSQGILSSITTGVQQPARMSKSRTYPMRIRIRIRVRIRVRVRVRIGVGVGVGVGDSGTHHVEAQIGVFCVEHEVLQQSRLRHAPIPGGRERCHGMRIERVTCGHTLPYIIYILIIYI